MRRCVDRAANITWGGFGGVLRPQWGARGAKPARSLVREIHPNREREGQSPLAVSCKVKVSIGSARGRARSHPCCYESGLVGSARGKARSQPSSRLRELRSRSILLGRFAEGGLTAWAAEVVGCALMLVGVLGSGDLHAHPADWVDCAGRRGRNP